MEKRLDDQIQNTHVKPLQKKVAALKHTINKEQAGTEKGDAKKLQQLHNQVEAKAAQVNALQAETAAVEARHFAGLKGGKENIKHTSTNLKQCQANGSR